MRLAVLADIHGNLAALEAVLSDIQGRGVDGYIIAGDHVNGGPRPVEVMRRLRALNAWMILGNTDNYLLDLHTGIAPDAWQTSKQWAVTRWSFHHIDKETLDFIASLPEQCTVDLADVAPIRVVHGSMNSTSEHLIPDDDMATMQVFQRAGVSTRSHAMISLSRAIVDVAEPVLVCGHSHIPWVHDANGRLALNPGSVGFSLNGDPRAQYALLTWRQDRWRAEFCAVNYDIARHHQDFVDSGLLEEGGGMARCFLINAETGRNVARAFLTHAHSLVVRAGYSDRKTVPNDIWDRAVATFDWQAVGE